MNPRTLTLPVVRRRWARRAQAKPPHANAKNREQEQLRADLPQLMQQVVALGGSVSMVTRISRQSLTRLQRELRDATESNPQIADDLFIQQFRKHLHLLLDH